MSNGSCDRTNGRRESATSCDESFRMLYHHRTALGPRDRSLLKQCLQRLLRREATMQGDDELLLRQSGSSESCVWLKTKVVKYAGAKSHQVVKVHWGSALSCACVRWAGTGYFGLNRVRIACGRPERKRRRQRRRRRGLLIVRV